MNTLRTLTTAVLLVTALVTISLADVTGEPGYFDLEWIEIPTAAEEIQDIDLTAVLSEVAADARQDGDTGLADVLAMVRSVRVKAFSVADEDPSVAIMVERANERLKEADWNRLIYVKDGDESVTVSSMHVEGQMVGIVVVAYEPGDGVVFVNVVGELDLATLLGLAGEFNLDDLDDYMEEYGGKHAQ